MSSFSRIRHLALVTALLATACDSGLADPPTEFPFAWAASECGPADGPAVVIALVQDTLPALPPGGAHVRVYLWYGLDDLTGRSWTVGGSSQDGVADYWDGSGVVTALRGAVDVMTVRADSTVEGEVDLVSGGTLSIRGGFRARWVTRTLICG